jgi:hypothetical protein
MRRIECSAQAGRARSGVAGRILGWSLACVSLALPGSLPSGASAQEPEALSPEATEEQRQEAERLLAEYSAVPRLKFGWQAGMRGWVDGEYVHRRTQQGEPLVGRGSVRYRFEVEEHERGLRLVIPRYELVHLAPGVSGNLPLDGPTRLASEAGLMLSTLVVGPSGRIELVELADPIAIYTRERLNQLATANEVELADKRRVSKGVASQAVVARVDDDLWKAIIIRWEGLPRAGLQAPARTELDDLGEADVTFRIAVEENVPCTKGEDPGRCVRVRQTMEPNADQFAQLIEESGLSSYELLEDTTVITEPDSLVPHRVHLRRGYRAARAGKPPFDRVDEQILIFTYDDKTTAAQTP